MEGLTEGRIVHYVLPNGLHRAAIIVKVWNKQGTVNLMVFLDGSNDDGYGVFMPWETSVTYDEGFNPRTWHWIEKA